MMHTYTLKTNYEMDESGQIVTVYGIEARNAKGDLLLSVPGIFCNLQKAIQFVSLCNDLKISLIHLHDVIEDALAE